MKFIKVLAIIAAIFIGVHHRVNGDPGKREHPWACGTGKLTWKISQAAIHVDCRDTVNQCCIQHDNCYNEQVGKEICDNNLRACLDYVTEENASCNTVATFIVNTLFSTAVKLFGGHYYKKSAQIFDRYHNNVKKDVKSYYKAGEKLLPSKSDLKELKDAVEKLTRRIPPSDEVIKEYSSKNIEAQIADKDVKDSQFIPTDAEFEDLLKNFLKFNEKNNMYNERERFRKKMTEFNGKNVNNYLNASRCVDSYIKKVKHLQDQMELEGKNGQKAIQEDYDFNMCTHIMYKMKEIGKAFDIMEEMFLEISGTIEAPKEQNLLAQIIKN